MYVKEFFSLSEDNIEALMRLTPKFGYDGFGEIVFYRTYSRVKSDRGQESWYDVVIRVINGTFSIRKDWYIRNGIEWDEAYWQAYAGRMAISLFRMYWMPAGRGMWAMGTEFVFRRGSMALNNCGATKLGSNDRLSDDLHWMMDALMLGVGVGFEPLRDDLKTYKPVGSFLHFVPDSREGWCDSLKMLVDSYTKPGRRKPTFDYSLVRPKGAPINGFGGLASGPEPLAILFKQVEQLFETPGIDVVRLKSDIANMIGCCVVAGNVRRSAELAMGSVKDPVFLDLKDWDKYPEREDYGGMSNNTVRLLTDDEFMSLGEVARRVVIRGEPGVANHLNFRKGRVGKRKVPVRDDLADLLNPCLMASTKLLTEYGIRRCDEISVGDKIWGNGGWTTVVKKWSTGVNPVYCYRTTAGAFYGTANHEIVQDGFKVKVSDADSIDSSRGQYSTRITLDPQDIMNGLVVGDGSYYNNQNILYIGEDDQDYFQSEVSHLIHGKLESASETRYRVTSTLAPMSLAHLRTVPDEYLYGDRDKVCSFLRGLYSANGSICGNRVTLKAASFDLIEAVQMMLSSVGIRSYYTTNRPTLVKHANGDFVSKESYDLNVSHDRDRFSAIIGFIQKYKKVPKVKTSSRVKTSFEIVGVVSLGEEETFDITVDNSTHTYWTQGCHVSNCGEIPLEDKELCNVVETCPTVCPSVETWYEACDFATFYASTVSLLPTHRAETNRVVVRNRRIGVGIIDWTGWVHDQGLHRVTAYMRKGYDVVTEVNQRRNAEAGVPESIRKTTIKPGGTGPKLPGRTPGIGNPTFDYTLRRMRAAHNNPVCPVLDAAGVPWEADFFDPKGTRIYEYPTLQGPAQPAEQVSLWEQAMNLVTVQREWSDNAVSNTLYFKPKWKLVFSRDTFIRDWNGDLEAQRSNEYKHSILFEVQDAFRKLGSDVNYTKSFQAMVPIKDEIPQSYRLITRKNKYGEWEVRLYMFDPNHEEDVIEKVLSAIVPLIKSCSLLPHTPKGAYRQMPEEGITKEEYEKRLAAIRPIDWSAFRGSDGLDEKYCTGASCELPSARP